MHLKSLEINGFKSFADRTKLMFEPGTVAIVGPNGCGKSNVSDAIRWVLGEQRPTSLRCAKMLDVIFNGTDNRKPVGMAEVSITFADCEGVLATEYNEVTITRRVFRSGEGQYFMNKTPCRLRDIHRLFMGTGIGTNSYSVMAQGQIDAILSSKPEDRRAIFEEAAGITKFKADRKEALRKLEQTDANLLRLADVIREVKRQIGSLQRQAGKAQRYRELRDEMRGLDLFVTRRRIAAADVRVRELDSELIALTASLAAQQVHVAEGEQATAAVHEGILQTEHLIGNLTQSAAQADSKLVRAQEVMRVNEQRIAEYRSFSERDTSEIANTRGQIETLAAQLADLKSRHTELEAQCATALAALRTAQHRFDEHRASVDAARAELQRLRGESVDRERRAATIQNQLGAMEARQRETLFRRERLSAESGQLTRALELVTTSFDEARVQLETRTQSATQHETKLRDIETERTTATTDARATQDEISRIQSQLAARRAQLDLLTDRDETADEFLGGSRQLLDSANPLQIDRAAVLGPLAEKMTVPPALRLAVEASLRAWIDAVAVRNADDARMLVATLLKKGHDVPARLVVADGIASSAPATPANLSPLLSHLTIATDFTGAANILLGHVFLADSLEKVPNPLPAGCTVVTREGAVFHANGCVEVWMPDRQVSSPLARRMLIADGNENVAALENSLTAARRKQEELQARVNALTASMAEARRVLDESKRQVAQKEGELQIVSRDADRSRQRLDTVNHELLALNQSTQEDDARKTTLADELQKLTATRSELVETISTKSVELQTLESLFDAVNTELSEARLHSSEFKQRYEHTAAQADAAAARLVELERTLDGRAKGVQSYEEGVQRLVTENAGISNNLGTLRDEAQALHKQIESTRSVRAAKARDLEKCEAQLAEHRQALEISRNRKAQADVELAECRMRRQNQLDRIYNEYALSPDQLVAEADPAWPNGQAPEVESVDTRVAELHAQIQAMGPVNLVAIEEYKELEERHAFLRAQESDLVKAKAQVIDLIRMINKKTSEMFQATFEQANANFDKMFTKLFNGGSAKLVLLENAEDPLECGVDIIARPPGKRPQTISLLSGGERTMTAVSLLFAIYMIKPSPFCLLDELDAALDDSNIGRFVQQLHEFLIHSQFLIITHSHQTIASSDIVYGVTMQEKGVSKVVSMRLKEIGVRELEMDKTSTETSEAADLPLPSETTDDSVVTELNEPSDEADLSDATTETKPAP